MSHRKQANSPQERRAICPGSFDPVTRGHLEVITRGAQLFDRIFVAVLENPSKTPLLSLEERVALLSRSLDGIANVEVVSYSGLTADLAAQLDARWILRGIRSAADVSLELPMAHSNRLCGRLEVETVFLPASPAVSFVSSSAVREIGALGGNLSSFVTPEVEQALRRKFGER